MTRALRDSIVRELENNLLPFWRERSVDVGGGGFIAEMAADGTVNEDAPRGLILNSRLLWTFSALFRELGDERDLALARRAFNVLESSFRDREHGGYCWLVDPGGHPLDRTKKTYGQAFCVYALSEFHRATDDQSALDAALELTELVDRHTRDDRHGGYLETRAADWSLAGDLRLSDKDMDAAKSMNNHLHLLEAFTNLQRVRPTADTEMKLYELIEIFGRYILERDPDGLRLRHFFDEVWRPLSDTRTYGHDIEAAWLLAEASEVLDEAVVDEEIIVHDRAYHTITEAKNGLGPAPIKTDAGWLQLAHGVRGTAAGLRYVLYAFMTGLDEPWRVIHEPGGYLLAPVGEEYIGDVLNVAFSCGWIARDDGSLYIYYASSDTRCHVATTTVDRLVDYCRNTPPDPGRSAACVEQRIALIDRNLKLMRGN